MHKRVWNICFCVKDEELYSGTSYNFLGSEPIISRHSHQSPLRTEYAIPWLNGKWAWELTQTNYFFFFSITQTKGLSVLPGIRGSCLSIAKRIDFLILTYTDMWVCALLCAIKKFYFETSGFLSALRMWTSRHTDFNLVLMGYSLSYIYLFILAIKQHGYDIGLFWFSNWAHRGSWLFQFLNFKIQVLWMLRCLLLSAEKDQNIKVSIFQKMYYVQKLHDTEFCSTCCNDTVIFSFSANSWNRGEAGKGGYISRPIRKLHLSVKDVEIMRYQTMEMSQIS